MKIGPEAFQLAEKAFIQQHTYRNIFVKKIVLGLVELKTDILFKTTQNRFPCDHNTLSVRSIK